MCRLYGFRANEATKVDCSLVYSQNALMQQSRVDRSGRDHPDGWGIVYYDENVPIVQKKTTAAFDDALFSMTAEQSYTQTLIAHVRQATVGENSIENTHPFVMGSWTFAHNGTITGFDRVGIQMQSETADDLLELRRGQTDSELYFFWLMTKLRSAGQPERFGKPPEIQEFIDDLSGALQILDQRCRKAAPERIPRLNFILTDGQTMIACRWNHTLHWILRRGLYNCQICGIPHIHHQETIQHRAIAIASEPVTTEQWSELPNQSLFLISPEIQHRAVSLMA